MFYSFNISKSSACSNDGVVSDGDTVIKQHAKYFGIAFTRKL